MSTQTNHIQAINYETRETIILVDHVGLELGGRLILSNVDAEIKDIVRPDAVQGQVVGFLGPSGIGKTQLSRVIAGLQKPTWGRVIVDGQPATKGRVGMVAQNSILFDWATVQQNLAIAGRKGGCTPQKIADQIASFVDTFGLGDYLNHYPGQLSGGTRQRVAIAQQLMCSEHFLIMDEPFASLDLIMKQRACETITKVANMDERNTIIVVTHDVTEAASISDCLWLMGHERDSEGKWMPGAKVVERYDLAKMGLCWHKDIQQEPEFLELVTEVKARFKTLKQF